MFTTYFMICLTFCLEVALLCTGTLHTSLVEFTGCSLLLTVIAYFHEKHFVKKEKAVQDEIAADEKNK